MRRTEDGGITFSPEQLAAGGRQSVYAVDQTGSMRVAEVRLPVPDPAETHVHQSTGSAAQTQPDL